MAEKKSWRDYLDSVKAGETADSETHHNIHFAVCFCVKLLGVKQEVDKLLLYLQGLLARIFVKSVKVHNSRMRIVNVKKLVIIRKNLVCDSRVFFYIGAVFIGVGVNNG